ncbi:PP2C family protein-serine/threonine phosphatase [Nonomuraea dietziae]
MAVERSLREAAPHAVVEAVRASLMEHYAVASVELLMADYGLSVLQPVLAVPYTAVPVGVHTGTAGRAFGAQEAVSESVGSGLTCVYLPVSVRGDRLGVLTVTFPDERCTPQVVEELTEVATVLGRELVVAERDTDVYLQARRTERLTLAAEMQWQLLPGRSCSRPEFDLGAQLEPAYAIYGDNFDWCTGANSLTLALTNGMGEGIDAALLTNLTVNALRNARRAGISLPDQAALADQAIYSQHKGRLHVETVLLNVDLDTGRGQVIDAGSPRLLRMRGKHIESIDFEQQLPLGMFDQTEYFTEEITLLPGDRLIFVSDGVHAVLAPDGEIYGRQALHRAINATRMLPAAEVPPAILREISEWSRTTIEDDALVMCLDWRGR